MNKSLVVLALLCASSASAMLNNTDQAFLANAARGNNFEIEAAKFALKMSRNAADRRYAQHMIADHTKLGNAVQAAVWRAGSRMTLPKTVYYSQSDMLNALKRSGRNFDSMYQGMMVKSHAQTYNLFDRYSRNRAANPQVRQVIEQAKPTVKMHWDEALELPRM